MITLLLQLLRLLPLLCGGHRQLALENLALHQQLAVYKRTVPRPKLRTTDRLFWVALARSGPGGVGIRTVSPRVGSTPEDAAEGRPRGPFGNPPWADGPVRSQSREHQPCGGADRCCSGNALGLRRRHAAEPDPGPRERALPASRRQHLGHRRRAGTEAKTRPS